MLYRPAIAAHTAAQCPAWTTISPSPDPTSWARPSTTGPRSIPSTLYQCPRLLRSTFSSAGLASEDYVLSFIVNRASLPFDASQRIHSTESRTELGPRNTSSPFRDTRSEGDDHSVRRRRRIYLP